MVMCCCEQVLFLAIKRVRLSHQRCLRRHVLASLKMTIFECLCRATAQDRGLLRNLGITHIVNAAHGPRHVDTGTSYYSDANVLYHGVEAADCQDFDLSPFFAETADFIHSGLSQNGGGPQETHTAHGPRSTWCGVTCPLSLQVRSSSTVLEGSAARQLWFWPS